MAVRSLSASNVVGEMSFGIPIRMYRGYVKIWRKIVDSPIFQDVNACHLFLYLLTQAYWNPETNRKIILHKEEITLKPGQVTIGRYEAARRTGLNASTLRNALTRLRTNYRICDSKSDNKKTLVTILNWDTYQSYTQEGGQVTGQQKDNERTLFKNVSIKRINNCSVSKKTKNETLEKVKLWKQQQEMERGSNMDTLQ